MEYNCIMKHIYDVHVESSADDYWVAIQLVHYTEEISNERK
jgi:hypothetical protein